MRDNHRGWGEILEEFEEETARFSSIILQPKKHAKHYNASKPDALARHKLTKHILKNGKLPKNTQVYYPYVAGMEYSIREALDWMKSPPARLREGLLQLAEGQQIEDLELIVALYGEFKERIGVLYARDPDHAPFNAQRKAKGDSALKRYMASYMVAAMRRENGNITFGRHEMIEHAKRIVDGKESPPAGFTAKDFQKTLKTPLIKADSVLRDTRIMSDRFLKELTGPKLAEWADELLISSLQICQAPSIRSSL